MSDIWIFLVEFFRQFGRENLRLIVNQLIGGNIYLIADKRKAQETLAINGSCGRITVVGRIICSEIVLQLVLIEY